MSQINFLTLKILLDINEQIKIRASKDPRIEYSGTEDYPIKMHELKKLIEYTPKNRDIPGMAAYYLKNIILLQAFPDANHRTALTAIEMFLENNNQNFDYTPVEAFNFRKELYEGRLRVYKTYEEMSTKVLREEDNQAENSVFLLCLKFVKTHTR
ncbi:MAG: Fic family protein [Euryarchaeota archaeon]|nr:Fic family protein [Euryarchaeota archaeon]MCG2735766.1 Fic family protein [Candidatus Methanoperedenaceae archaeon]MDP3103310.1 Fic family protein [Candidatus Methanoperedens sp.]